MPDEKLIDLELRYYDNEDYDEHFKDLLEAMNEGTIGGCGGDDSGGSSSGDGENPTGKVAWSNITGTPTTVDGYGITDAVKTGDKVAWNNIENAPTTLEGYGITDAVKTGDKISWNDIESAPTTLEGYGITDAVKASDEQQTIAADTVTANTFTGELVGNAGTATKLKTPVNVAFTGITADSTTFDGSADLNINVTNVPASLVTGVLSEANIPATVVSTLKTVNSDEERFALTIDDVQNGDTVFVSEPAPGKMYRVIDDTKLNEEAGYREFSAGIADKALADSEGNIINETYLTKTDAASTYSTKAELTSEVETINSALDGKQDAGDYALKSDLSAYATTESVTSSLAAKADSSVLANYATTSALTEGLETKADVDDLANYVTEAKFAEDLATKADASVLSGYATTTALTEGLATKADTADLSNYATNASLESLSETVSTKVDSSTLTDYVTDEALTELLSEKADASALANYATTQSVEEVNAALDSKANAVHTHVTADITDINDLLDGYVDSEQLTAQLANKADTVHEHVVANITDFNETMAGYATSTALTEGLAAKADTATLANYALKSELTDYATTGALESGLEGKANAAHTHTMSDITDFPSDLVYESDLIPYAKTSEVDEKIVAKADSSELSNYALKSELESYATTESVTLSLAAKADVTALDNYATTTALSDGLATKANTADLANYATNESLESLTETVSTKADSSALTNYVTTDTLNTELANKADSSVLANYATTEALTSGLAAKADTSVLSDYVTTVSLEEELANKADTSALSAYATTESVTSGLAGKADTATTISGYNISDAYTKDEVDTAIEEVTPILVNIPISGTGAILRTEPNQVYESSVVFGWFGVEDNNALQALILSGRPMYVRQGLTLSTVPSYYMMPIVYIGYTASNSNKLEMSIIGNDTTNDKTIKYQVNINLDGTLLSETSNITVKKFYLDPKPAYHVGDSAPEDTDLLWLDSGTKMLKYYDSSSETWTEFGTFSA